MKFQHPTSNIQKSAKHQRLKARGASEKLIYPERNSSGWVLNDSDRDGDSGQHPFDLEQRTAQFGEAIVRFCKRLPKDTVTDPLRSQLVRCGTSIGANYIEANESFSKKDFRFSINRCVKEARESKHFLRMIAAAEPPHVDEARRLHRE